MSNKKWLIPVLALGAALLVGLILLGIGALLDDETDVGPQQQPTRTSNPE
ncbi:hypothetical protein [Nocardioides sp. CFH 31398]|nr:hypothetical protein [Nocardioides sp. CFH 31398]MCH1867079.1 hypothetical protein [Nocardioides sp. CFH 31398]